MRYSIALGKEDFIKKIKKYIYSYGRHREIQVTRSVSQYSPEKIISQISQNFQITLEEILVKKRGNIYKIIALYLIKKFTPLSLKEIGELFLMDYTTVSQAVRRFEEKMTKDKKLNIKYNGVYN